MDDGREGRGGQINGLWLGQYVMSVGLKANRLPDGGDIVQDRIGGSSRLFKQRCWIRRREHRQRAGGETHWICCRWVDDCDIGMLADVKEDMMNGWAWIECCCKLCLVRIHRVVGST